MLSSVSVSCETEARGVGNASYDRHVWESTWEAICSVGGEGAECNRARGETSVEGCCFFDENLKREKKLNLREGFGVEERGVSDSSVWLSSEEIWVRDDFE